MTSTPFISVVIPTYNRAREVQAALASVMAQSYVEYEVIVVDDGSTDGTQEALQQTISQTNDRDRLMRYFFQPHRGQSAARNRGIAEARGQWIAFLDSDDTWYPDKLAWQMQAVGEFRDRCGACVTDATLTNLSQKDTTAFRESGRAYQCMLGIEAGAVTQLATSFSHYWVSTLMANAAVVRQIGGFDPDVHFAEDHDFAFRLALATSFCFVNQPLATIDRGGSPAGSTCRPWDKAEVRLRGQQAMFEKWLRLASLSPGIQQIVTRNLRNVHSAWTNWYLEQQRYHEARQAASRAIGCSFTPSLAVKWLLTCTAPAFARRISPRTAAQ